MVGAKWCKSASMFIDKEYVPVEFCARFGYYVNVPDGAHKSGSQMLKVRISFLSSFCKS